MVMTKPVKFYFRTWSDGDLDPSVYVKMLLSFARCESFTIIILRLFLALLNQFIISRCLMLNLRVCFYVDRLGQFVAGSSL